MKDGINVAAGFDLLKYLGWYVDYLMFSRRAFLGDGKACLKRR
jgi:hypothetical protein